MRKRTNPVPPLLLCLSAAVAVACGGGGGDDGDTGAPDETESGPTDSPPITPPSGNDGPLPGEGYPNIVNHSSSVEQRYPCDAKNDGVIVCCADYRMSFSLDNNLFSDITRLAALEVIMAPLAGVSTGPIDCAAQPWAAASGVVSEPIDVLFKYKGANGLPSIAYPCNVDGPAVREVDLPVDILPPGDAPVLAEAGVKVDGYLLSGVSWYVSRYDPLINATQPCQ